MRNLVFLSVFVLAGCMWETIPPESQMEPVTTGQVQGVAPQGTVLPGQGGPVPQIVDEGDDKAPLYDIR